MPVWRQFSGWNLSLFLTEKNGIGCHELQARWKCSKKDPPNYEKKRNARKRARPITSKKEMLKGRRVQLRANGKCSKEGPPNCEQKEFARRRTRPIAILNIGGCGYAPIGGSPDRTMQQHIQVFLT